MVEGNNVSVNIKREKELIKTGSLYNLRGNNC